jgi:vacuolar-type H+-ATPase subunit I/STV1
MSQRLKKKKEESNLTTPVLEEVDHFDIATMDSDTTIDQSYVTTDSRTDIHLKAMEDIIKELNYLREENKELKEKYEQWKTMEENYLRELNYIRKENK